MNNSIISKYYLLEGSTLVKHTIHSNGNVDCWFDSGDIRQHRCLSLEDFTNYKSL
jgi:hypothetical protein